MPWREISEGVWYLVNTSEGNVETIAEDMWKLQEFRNGVHISEIDMVGNDIIRNDIDGNDMVIDGLYDQRLHGR